MKIQCDVCCKKEASVFCSADEAALCDVCDQRVHHANKLASKHERFALLHHSSPSLAPLCDICKEKRALVFCQEDRAIMCRDCELPLHTANEHTKKHNRFLLTGIKLSRMIDDRTSSNGCDPVPDFKAAKKPSSVSSEFSSSGTVLPNTGCDSNGVISSANDQLVSGGSTSSISEYLIDMLPGWHFEDFLHDFAFGFSKVQGANKNDFDCAEDMLSFLDVNLDNKITSSSSTQSDNSGIWVPQAPVAAATSTTLFGQSTNFYYNPTSGLAQGTKQQETSVSATKMNRKLRKDDGFTVPQITHSVGSKRTRPFW